MHAARGDLSPDVAGLLRPDGSIVIPASIAADVSRRLLRDLGREVQANGGRLPPATYRLLWALHEAARAEAAKGAEIAPPPGSVPGTSVAAGASVEIGTAEAARRMGCSESYVRRLARLGLVPARRVAGVWLITRAAGAVEDESEAA